MTSCHTEGSILFYHAAQSDKGGWAMWQPCASHVAATQSSALSWVLPSNPGRLVKCQSSDTRIPFVAFLYAKKQIFQVVITKIRSLFICKKYNLKKKTQTESAASATSRSVRKDFILLLIWDSNLCSYFAYWHQNWCLLFVTSESSHTLGKMGITDPIHHQNLGYKRNVSSYLRKRKNATVALENLGLHCLSST